MPLLSISQKNALLDATTIATLSLHSAYSASGGNEIAGGSPAYARLAVTFSPAAAGQKAATGLPLTFDVPTGTIAWLGTWDSSGGYCGMQPLGGDSLRPFVLDDTSTGTLRCAGHGFVVGDTCVVWAGDATALPTGLVEGTIYYVVSASVTTLQLSTTAGGAALGVSTPGNGYLQRILPQTYTAQATFPIQSFVLDAMVAG